MGNLSACHYQSPPTCICRKGIESTFRVDSYKGLHLGKFQPCLEILDKAGSEVTNTLAYYATESNTALKKQFANIQHSKQTLVIFPKNENVSSLAIKGGVISISIQWDCNLDQDFLENWCQCYKTFYNCKLRIFGIS